MTVSDDDPASERPRRRLPTRAEATTLVGMTGAIGSLFLPWERMSPPAETASFPAYYAGSSLLTGFQTFAHWPLTLSAAVCGLCLLWAPVAKIRLPLLYVQSIGGLVSLLIPLTQWMSSKFAPWPGVLIALFSGALLLFGALDRFTGPVPIPPR